LTLLNTIYYLQEYLSFCKLKMPGIHFQYVKEKNKINNKKYIKILNKNKTI